MKKIFTFIILILILFVLASLVFDFGRRIPDMTIVDQKALMATTTENDTLPIVVYIPKDNQEVENPIIIKGKAKGSWFFEGQFPIDLIDTSGNILSSSVAIAESDWVTEKYINFSSELTYSKSTTTKQVIVVLHKNNSSGNPNFDKQILIPVVLK